MMQRNTKSALTDDHRQAVEAFRKRHRTALLALLFTDIEGSTALKNEIGELPASALIERHGEVVRDVLADFADGQEIFTAGDSFFLVFAKPSDAARFALRAQFRLRELAAEQSADFGVKMGIHLGEVVVAEDGDGGAVRDVLGMQVDLASRVCSLAVGNQILMTRGVFDNARQILKGQQLQIKGDLSWLSHGPYLLKGFDEPLAICEVGETGVAALREPADSDTGKRATMPGAEPVLGWRPAIEQVVPGTEWALDKQLGEGGFGEVWLARHRRTKDLRVFKFCFRADQLRSLKREMTLFRLLKEVLGERQDIARLYSVQFEEAPYYLELEYTPGGDLGDWIEERGGFENLPMELRLEIVAQIATALAAAHSVGVIHEDVKPSNVLVEEKKAGQVANLPHSVQVRLTDFGIGQVTDRSVFEHAGMTATGMTDMVSPSAALSTRTGTRLYMAPELIAGRPPSTKSDIYSLGVLLYQMIVGDLTQPMTPDWGRRVDDPLLREDLEGCLAGEPDDRFAGAEELALRLRTLDDRRTALAERETAERVAERWRKFHRALMAASAIVVLLALALGYGLYREHKQWEQTEDARKDAVAEKQKTEQQLYFASIALAEKYLGEARCGSVLQVLGDSPQQYWNWEVGRLAYLCNQDLMTLSAHSDQVWSVAFSPDGKRLATAGQDGSARIWDVETGRELQALDDGNWVRAAIFSPDGRRMALANYDQTASVWDLDTGRELLTFKEHTGPLRGIAFSPDGKRLATASGDETIRIWSPDTGEVSLVLQGHSLVVTSVAYSPDGTLLATSSGDGTARVWDAATGHGLRVLKGHAEGLWVNWVAFSPDGKRVATTSDDKTARIWDVETGRELRTLRGHAMRVRGVAFSPDGRRLATTDDGGVARIWDTETGRELFVLKGHWTRVWCVAFSPDGRRLATGEGNGKLKFWDLEEMIHRPPTYKGDLEYRGGFHFIPQGKWLSKASQWLAMKRWNESAPAVWYGEAGRQMRAQGGATYGDVPLALSPDGRTLAVALGQSIETWDVKERTRLLAFEAHNYGVSALAFSPDGRRLLSGGADETARLWDVDTGREIMALEGHEHPVEWVAFSPDGLDISTGSDDGAVILWRAFPWKPEGYPGKEDEDAFGRIEQYKREYWNQRMAERTSTSPIALAERTLDASAYAPAIPVRVRLDLAWNADASSLTVVENVPEGWSVEVIRTKDQRQRTEVEGNTLMWEIAPWTSPGAALEYTATPPDDAGCLPVRFQRAHVSSESGWWRIPDAILRRSGHLVFQNGVHPDPDYAGCEDTHILVWSADFNTGATTRFEQGSRLAGNDDQKKALVRFDLSSVPSTYSLARADLRLLASGEEFGDHHNRHTLYVARVLKPWSEGRGGGRDGQPAREGEVTYNSARHGVESWEKPGAMGLTDVADANSSATAGENWPGWMTLDVTESVRYFLANPDKNFGWKISQDPVRGVEDSTIEYVEGAYQYVSSEASEIRYRPMLILVPGEK